MAYEDLLNKIGDILDKSTRSIRDRLTLDVTDLLRAVDANDPEEVARALRAGVNPDKDDGIGRFALLLAVDNNYSLIAGLIIKSGANPNIRDANGQTALLKAVSWENEDLVKLLLEAGADPNIPDSNQMTALTEARDKGYTSIIEMITQSKDQSKSQQVEKDKATHQELKNKGEEAKRKKAEREARDAERAKAKAEREERRNQKKAERSISKYYPEMKEGNYLSAFIRSLKENDSEAAGILFDRLDDLNAVDPVSGLTPLIAAFQCKIGPIAVQLIKAGADTTSVPQGQKHSPLTYAIIQEFEKPVKLILDHHPEGLAQVLNQKDQLLSPQFLAYKDAQIMNMLLEAGADPFFGGSAAPSPIIKAIEKASISILPVLVKHKVDLDHRMDGRSPLEWAIHFDRLPWLVGLIEEGANIDLINDKGYTPLMEAVLANRAELVRVLIQENADTTLKNSEGKTAAQLAEGNPDLLELFE